MLAAYQTISQQMKLTCHLQQDLISDNETALPFRLATSKEFASQQGKRQRTIPRGHRFEKLKLRRE